MRVGIYTHYAHCDQAYLAVRLAQLLLKVGADFGIYSDCHPARLGLKFDNGISTRASVKFTNWAQNYSVIIWTHVPTPEQILWAKRRQIRTVVAPMWQELRAPFRKALNSANIVVTMSTECQTLFSDIYKIRSAQLIPFDTGLPIVKKNKAVNPRQLKLFLPWFDRNARCTGGNFIDALKFLIEHTEELHLQVAITPSQFSPSIAKFFVNLARKTGRVSLIRGVPVAQRPALYSAADLTIFPAECDNYGLCPLTSITVGTPVLTTAIPPQLDFLYPDENAGLLLTKTDYDENGVIHALPDYGQFLYLLQHLTHEPRYIQKMMQKTNYNLITRRNAFEMGWTNIFDA